MSYAIEVQRRAARMVGFDNRSFDLHVFLHTVGSVRLHDETLVERLNDPDLRFLPCEIGGRIELVHLAWIAYLELSELPPEIAQMRDIGICSARVAVELMSGAQLEGELLYEAAEGRRRLSDFLNEPACRFLVLVSDGGVRYLNRAAISRLRESTAGIARS